MIVQLTTARQLAITILEAESCLYSQWFPGAQNEVSDACSRDFHLTDNELTQLMLTSVPNQVPFGFKLFQLPSKITSWLICLLRNQPQKQLWNQQQIPSKLSLGTDTSNTSHQLPSQMTFSLKSSPNINESEYLALSHTQFMKTDSILKDLLSSSPGHVEPPSIAWHRPSAWQIDPTQDLTRMENLLYFYTANSKATKS